jgi:hypothetical protein
MAKIRQRFVLSPAQSVDMKEEIKQASIITDNSLEAKDPNLNMKDAANARFLLSGGSDQDIIKKKFLDNKEIV